MTTSITKTVLSGSSYGAGILVAATSSTGTTIHATGTSSVAIDEVWLFAYNSSVTQVNITIQYGGTTSPNNDIKLSIPSQSGLTLVVPGLILTGTGSSASTVYAYADSANVITITGYVNRITVT